MDGAPHHTSLCIATAIRVLLAAGAGCYNPWAATPCAGAAACTGTLLSPGEEHGLLMCEGTVQGIKGITAKGINKPGA